MWISQVTRAEFLNVVQSERQLSVPDGLSLEQTTAIPKLSSDLLLAWKIDPRKQPALPCLIVLAEGATHDFLSWTSSYLMEYRPLTAQVRVLEQSHVDRYFVRTPEAWLGRLQSVCVAMVLAEMLGHLDGDRELRSLPGVAFGNTYAFSRARDLAVWGIPDRDEWIFEQWQSARSLSCQPKLPFTAEELIYPWRIIAQVAGSCVRDSQSVEQKLFSEAAFDVSSSGTIRDEVWSQLIGRAGLVDAHVLQRTSSREDRVLAWELVSRQRPGSEAAQLVHTFLCGYLANAVAPGSFEHWSLVLRSAAEPRGALLWYGLFAGLTPGSAVRDAFGGLGRRLLRDITSEASVLDRPRADIALTELAVLGSHRGRRPDVFTASSNMMLIEIAPCISTLVRWGGGAPAQEQLFERSERSADMAIESALLELREGLTRVEGAHKRLLRAFGIEFDSRRPARGGGRS